MQQLHLGAQFYTLREYTKTPEDFRETMRKVKEIGYKYVQVSGVGPDVDYKVIADAVNETGIKVVLTHTPIKRIKEETDAVIAEHSAFGCDYIGVGGLGCGLDEENIMNFCEEMKPVFEKFRAAGKKFLFHNHAKEFDLIGETGKNAFDMVLENTPADVLGLTLDTYWATYAGLDAAAVINKYADRIAVTHFKDMQIKDGEKTMTEMLEGIIDYDPIIAACDANNIMWNFIEQDTVYINAFDSMKISHDNMKKRYNFD